MSFTLVGVKHTHPLCKSIPFTGRPQTSTMAQCGKDANASSAVNSNQARRKVALITGITGQVTLPTVYTHHRCHGRSAVLAKLETKLFPCRGISASVLHLNRCC